MTTKHAKVHHLFLLLIQLCLDINECIDDNGGCSDSCTNTIGSYYCSCNSGYTMNTDKHNCTGMFSYY